MERERDLVEALRAELAAIEPSRSCCRRAERVGLGAAAIGRARSPSVARLAARLAARSAVRSRAVPEAGFDWDAAADHCRVAWLRGIFLAYGSLSLSGGTHLELVVAPADAGALVGRVSQLGLPAAWRVRRGRGVVTWKGRERVLTFLRRVGASAAALELESRAVTRTLHGDLNRAFNAESANLRRSVGTATRQIAAFEHLEDSGQLDLLAPFDRDVARLRRAEPSQSFSDLALRLGVSRARVQRALARMESVAARATGGAGMG